MNRASIGIFPNKIEYSDNGVSPITPKEVFEAAQRVAKHKTCELIRTNAGLFIVNYSENGPGKETGVWSDWMPVYIARIKEWTAGGIKNKELEKFLSSQKENNDDHQL